MSVLLVTPEFAPQRGGVADYSSQLAAHLAGRGRAIEVLAPRGAHAEPGARFSVRPEISDWGWRGTRQLARACRQRRHEGVLVQYVPYLYQRHGLPFHLAAVATRARDPRDARVVLVCHELFIFGGRARHRALGALQQLVLRVLERRVDVLVVTTQRRLDLLSARGYARERLRLVRVGSSLPEGVTARPGTGSPFRVVVFGNLEVERRRLDLVHRAVERLGAQAPNATVELQLVGATPEASATFLRTLPEAGLGFRVRALGPLPGPDVAARLAVADVGVHLDTTGLGGVSSRSTACAALLAAGLPVIGNEGSDTDDIYRDRETILFCRLEADDLADKLALLRADAALRRRLGIAGKQLYERELSWDRISSDFVTLLDDRRSQQ